MRPPQERAARPHRRALYAAAALCATAALAACSSSSSSSSSSSASAPASAGTSGSPAAAPSSASGAASGPAVGVSLILKTLTNPYFVTMKSDAQAAAAKDGVNLTVAAGSSDGDTQSQITAIDNAISRGDKGILITTNGNAVNAALNQAKQQGLFVIALDTAHHARPASPTSPTPPTTRRRASSTASTRRRCWPASPPSSRCSTCSTTRSSRSTSTATTASSRAWASTRAAPRENGQEAKTGTYTGGGKYTIACHQPTQGAIDGGRTAMENCLSANPNINVVYAINEPAAEGAYARSRPPGKQNEIKVFAIDGSCSGLKLVTSGEFTADAVQYPGKMAVLGMEAIAKLARGGSKPAVTNGLSFYNTGTALVASKTVSGVTTETPAQGASACWGS